MMMMMQRGASFSNLSMSSASGGRSDRNQSTASIASASSKVIQPMVTMKHTTSMESIKDCNPVHSADIEKEDALETIKAVRGPPRRYPMLEEVGRLPSCIDLDDEGDGDEIQNDALTSLPAPQEDDASSQGDASSTYLGREDDCLTRDDPSSDDDSSSDGDASSTYLGRDDDGLTHDDPSSDDDSSSDGDASSTYLGREDDGLTHDDPSSDGDSSSDGDASSTYLGRDDDSTHGLEGSDSSSDGDASSTYLGKDDPSSYDDPNLLESSSSEDDDSIDANLYYESHALAWEPYKRQTETTPPVAKSGNDNHGHGTSRPVSPIAKDSNSSEYGNSHLASSVVANRSSSSNDNETSSLLSPGTKTSNNENGASTINHDDHDFVVEVAPNVFKTIRGANRVIRAWRNGDCIEAMCFACDIRLACTDDCEGVVCPTCFSVSPVEGHKIGVGESYIGIGLRIN